MKVLSCEKCGSNDLQCDGNYLVCPYCGSKYLMDPSDKQVKQSNISLGSDVERLLEKCRREPRNARKYANLILDIDPTNKEALKYL